MHLNKWGLVAIVVSLSALGFFIQWQKGEFDVQKPPAVSASPTEEACASSSPGETKESAGCGPTSQMVQKCYPLTLRLIARNTYIVYMPCDLMGGDITGLRFRFTVKDSSGAVITAIPLSPLDPPLEQGEAIFSLNSQPPGQYTIEGVLTTNAGRVVSRGILEVKKAENRPASHYI
jgi:hypothetical protein